MPLSDRVTGIALAGLGAAAVLGASRLPPIPGQSVGPAAFPSVVGAALVVAGLAIAFVKRPSEAAVARDRLGLGGLLRLAIPPALLLFYVFASDALGFLLTAAIMVLAAALALGAPMRLALSTAIVSPLVVHAVFGKLLRVALPDGLLAPPW